MAFLEFRKCDKIKEKRHIPIPVLVRALALSRPASQTIFGSEKAED